MNFGPSPEALKELTEAASRGATDQLASVLLGEMLDLSKRLGVTEDATKTLLRIVGEQDVPLERLSETLNRVANDYKRLQEQVAVLNPVNAIARDLVTQVRAAIDVGQFERAHQLLREATQAQLNAAQAARKLRDQAQAAEDAQMLGAASVTAVDAGVALTEGKYQQAAELFGQAAEYVPPGYSDARDGYLLGQADALHRQGFERGNNDALRRCIEILHRVLEGQTRDRVPLDWATTQMHLGAALTTLGGRESGTARLEEAVAAYRLALEEITRERMPEVWATAQVDLAWALSKLGEHEAGTVHLWEAVAASRDALREWTREHMPIQWAAMQDLLGGTLWTLDQREAGTVSLEEAMTAFRAALQERTRERDPFSWAASRHHLGLVLRTLGQKEAGTARLEEAVTAFLDAAQEITRERMPAIWAYSQHDLADALAALAKRQMNAVLMKEALTCMRNAVEVYQQGTESFWLPVAQGRVKEMEAELVRLQR